MKGKVFAFGGYRSFETELYDQDSNTWTFYKEIPFRDFDKPYFWHMTVGRFSTQIIGIRPVLDHYYTSTTTLLGISYYIVYIVNQKSENYK